MKLLIILLSFVSFQISFSQNKTEVEKCNVELTIEELIDSSIKELCKSLEQKHIAHFKIKIQDHKSVWVKSDTMSIQSKAYISKAKVGDIVSLFDITFNSKENGPPIRVTLIE